MAKQKKQKRIIGSLAELKASTFTAVIELEDEEWEFPCKELSYSRFHEIGMEVQDPTPEQFAGPKGVIYNTQEPLYQQRKADADRERALRRVAEMLDYPGQSTDDKIIALKDTSPAVINGLVSILMRRHFAKEVRIEAKSHSFPAGGTSHRQDIEGDAVELGAVDSLNGSRAGVLVGE